jgi:hypothetical protein
MGAGIDRVEVCLHVVRRDYVFMQIVSKQHQKKKANSVVSTEQHGKKLK